MGERHSILDGWVVLDLPNGGDAGFPIARGDPGYWLLLRAAIPARQAAPERRAGFPGPSRATGGSDRNTAGSIHEIKRETLWSMRAHDQYLLDVRGATWPRDDR